MLQRFRPTANLTAKLSWRVARLVLLLLLVLGVYFDLFLRNSFLDSTSLRARHAYQRLAYNLGEIQRNLQEGAAFARTDESLIASVDLINRYQDKHNYNTFLIDEEKKTLAHALLSRVKLGFHDDIALFNDSGELIAFAVRAQVGYRMGYVSYARKSPEFLQRSEYADVFESGPLPTQFSIHHGKHPRDPQSPQSSLITFHREDGRMVIKVHQTVSDAQSGRALAQLEMSRALGPDYFAALSQEQDVRVEPLFDHPQAAQARLLEEDGAVAALTVHKEGDTYVGLLRKDLTEGAVVFRVAMDAAVHNAVLNTHRARFLGLMLVLTCAVLLWMRHVLRQGLERPLTSVMAQVRRIEQGRYEPGTLLRTGDELQTISDHIHHMALAVHEREASLERARHEQEFLSNHDALTGLPNRRLFAQRLEQSIQSAQRRGVGLAIMFLDLDQFKLVNDTLGHDIGDQLLVQVGQRLARRVRSADTLARIGGDEFNILIEGVSEPAEIEPVARMFLSLFQPSFDVKGHWIDTTVSMGIAVYPRDGADSVSLLKSADLAVYKAKARGRGGYSFFSEELSRMARERADLINALNLAIDAGDQFSMAYQPKICARSGRIVSAEALIRWHAPGLGDVSPMRFIPIAEETGQILAIGAWVVRQVCRDMAEMAAQGLLLDHVSLNVSNVQLRTPGLLALLQDTATRFGLQPRQLELEITESYIAHDTQDAVQALHAFRQHGFQLAIDDFGTGYSSLSYLQKLPFTRLKLDKSFIDGLPGNPDNAVLTRAIIALARNFGMQLTAEGVERSEQLAFLTELGCDEVQGYLFAQALGLADFMAFARQPGRAPDRLASVAVPA